MAGSSGVDIDPVIGQPADPADHGRQQVRLARLGQADESEEHRLAEAAVTGGEVVMDGRRVVLAMTGSARTHRAGSESAGSG